MTSLSLQKYQLVYFILLTNIQLRALTAQVPIKKDTEILVNYMMTLAKSPEWYRVIWLQHMRKTKKGDDAAIQRSAFSSGKVWFALKKTSLQIRTRETPSPLFMD